MIKTILSLAFFSLTSLAFGQDKGIKFEQGESWQQIKNRAKAENKCIFVDVFATWCSPCKAMDINVYPSEKVGVFMKDKFIAIKIQGDKTINDTESVRSWYRDSENIMATYQVDAYPTLLFFSPEGNLIHRAGSCDVEGLIHHTSEMLERSKQYSEMLYKYNAGNMSTVEIREFALFAKSVGDSLNAQNAANDYIDNYLFKQSDSILFTRNNLRFIGDFLNDPNSRAVSFFINNSEKINVVLGTYTAQNIVISFIDKKYLPQNSSWKGNPPNWNRIMNQMVDKFGDVGHEAVLGKQMMYFLDIQEWSKYAKFYTEYLKLAFRHPFYEVNNMSWYIFENVDDQKILTFACDTVMKYAMEEWYPNDYAAYDTYANLLYKLGRKQEAIEWEEQAVKFSNSNKALVKTLVKMKKGVPTWTK